ncbi:MAG TPA: hypothetical protein VHT92_01625 [Candidatus Cybelea sp.]|jgi:foldase protein PrsA|nr:hypothetical protein [Candidatus Cybelea sp.]
MRAAPHLVAGLAALLSSTLVTACSSGSSGAAVTVNGQVISRAFVLEKIEQHPEARQALGHIIGETLINQYAEQHHIVVTDAEVAARERLLRAQLPGKKWNDMLAVRNISDSGVPTLVRTELLLDKIVANDVRVSDADVAGYYEKHRALYQKRGESLASATPQITALLREQESSEYSLGVMEDLTRQANIVLHDPRYADMYNPPKLPSDSAKIPVNITTQ